jgi:ribosomal protein S18 acetylase RimI-like enzyme
MKLRKPSIEEFEAWFKLSCELQAKDRAFAKDSKEEDELKELEKIVPHLLPNGMDTDNHYFRVFDNEEENVGFIWLGVLPGLNKNEIFLMDIIVSKDHRRKGLGKWLLLAMQEEIKKLGYKKIILNVMERNFAKKLYESLGYITVEANEKNSIMALEL